MPRMKVGDLIKVNTTRASGTWIVVGHPNNYTFRIVGVDHNGLESDLEVDARWAVINMEVISSCK